MTVIDMHVHAGYDRSMRTTIELHDSQRARLLQVAAERGEKGFSGIVQEALELYFVELAAKRVRVRKALDVLGRLDTEAADRLAAETRLMRESWR